MLYVVILFVLFSAMTKTTLEKRSVKNYVSES